MSINEITHQQFLKQSCMSFFVKKTESTNFWAKQKFQGQFPFSLFLADEQTQGRGRNSNSWTNSTPGHTLLSTWCLSLASHPQPLFPLRVGLLLFEACKKTWPPLPWALKAPNDIYIGDSKWAGILIEVAQTPLSVCAYIGVGANILSAPKNVGQKTTALIDHTRLAENDWQAFCYFFYDGLLQIQKDPSRTKLTNTEILRLQSALEKYHDNKIQTVLPDGSLELESGETIPWSEL
jgi:BirA family transcriptional regulator, biotin operon repressor / biotin---[acetyl-CoA-carboxylase] ligase